MSGQPQRLHRTSSVHTSDRGTENQNTKIEFFSKTLFSRLETFKSSNEIWLLSVLWQLLFFVAVPWL